MTTHVKVRTGIWETNSSSTHSIVIPKKNKVQKESLVGRTVFADLSAEFGWEFSNFNDTDLKAAYLLLGIKDVYDDGEDEDKIKEVKNTLDKYGVELVISESNEGYIDHGYELKEFVDSLLVNEDLLLNYLFSDQSEVFTGNDNSDYSCLPTINKDTHHEFYKGN